MQCKVKVRKWIWIKLKLWLAEKAAKKYKIHEDGHAVFVEQVFVETQYSIYTQKGAQWYKG